MRQIDKQYKTRVLRKISQLGNEELAELKSLLDEIDSINEQCRYMDKETILATEIRPTTYESFCRHGDRNQLTKLIILNHLRYVAIPLDSQAKDLTDLYGIKFTEQDFIEFYIHHPTGTRSYHKFKEKRSLQDTIRKILGLNPDRIFEILKNHITRNMYAS